MKRQSTEEIFETTYPTKDYNLEYMKNSTLQKKIQLKNGQKA